VQVPPSAGAARIGGATVGAGRRAFAAEGTAPEHGNDRRCNDHPRSEFDQERWSAAGSSIKTDAPEKFSVYEMKDGKPNLVTYDLREGTYIIPKIMDSGYVELGKKKTEFTRKG
jgi:hypothetical protein